jgi:hypothetical protein
MVTACCNACRTCVTTNIAGLALAGVAALAGFAKRLAQPLAGRGNRRRGAAP